MYIVGLFCHSGFVEQRINLLDLNHSVIVSRHSRTFWEDSIPQNFLHILIYAMICKIKVNEVFDMVFSSTVFSRGRCQIFSLSR